MVYLLLITTPANGQQFLGAFSTNALAQEYMVNHPLYNDPTVTFEVLAEESSVANGDVPNMSKFGS